MCGRYTLTRHERVAEDLEAAVGPTAQSEWWKARFNVAPTQPAPVVTLRDGHPRTIEMMRWGLVPFWAGRDGKKAPLMINARRENLMAKAFFREALAERRCLVPADGFFEWIRHGLPKGEKPQPIYLHPASGKLVAFAGLWARAKTDAGETQLSFTIITCPPNELVKPVHDRMPCVLDPTAYATWLDPTVDAARARELLVTPAVGEWIGEPVSTVVNTATNDDPRCVEPVRPPAPAQRSLF